MNSMIPVCRAVRSEGMTWGVVAGAIMSFNAVGGNWGGKNGVDDGIFPQRMVVDYVRVYEGQ